MTEFIIKARGIKTFECIWVQSIEDAAGELERLGDDVVWIRELEEGADVFKNMGVWSGVEHKVAKEWIKQFGDDAEMEFGTLTCPDLVHAHCAAWVTETECLLTEDWADAMTDYRNSVGVRMWP